MTRAQRARRARQAYARLNRSWALVWRVRDMCAWLALASPLLGALITPGEWYGTAGVLLVVVLVLLACRARERQLDKQYWADHR